MSKVTIRKATREDVEYIVANIREEDLNEIMATRWSEDFNDFVNDYSNGPSTGHVALLDGVPVGVSGVTVWQPKVGQAWLFGTERIGEIGLTVLRECKKEIDRMFKAGTIHRLQAFSIDTHKQAHSWLRLIGFHQESIIKKLGKNGEDFISFAYMGPK